MHVYKPVKKYSTMRILSLLICAALLLTSCASSGGSQSTQSAPATSNAKEPAEPSEDSTAAKITDTAASTDDKKPITVSYWVNMHTNAAKILNTWNDNECFQELERRTGVHVNFIHPPVGQEAEQYNLMIASRDLPDIISWNYPDGADKAIAENIYRPLNDLMDYNPNMSLIIDSDPEIRKQMTTPNGNIWGWGTFTLPQNQGDKGQYTNSPWGGPAIRADWLEELGLSVPETIDEWYNVLVAFRDQKGASVPLILAKTGQPWVGTFIGAYGVGPGFYRVDNVVKYGPIEPGYKEYLTTMHQWYREGLLDPDFASTASDSNFYAEYMTTGKAGAIDVTYQDIVPLYNSLFENGEGRVTAVPYPSGRKGDAVHIGVHTPIVDSGNSSRSYLTTAVTEDRLEAICRWKDSWYTEESYMLFNYGIEGRSYNMENGKPVFTDLIANNPDGLDYAVSSWKYKLFCHSYSYNAFAMPQPQIDASWASIGVWASNNDRAYQMPPSSIPLDNATQYSNIMTEADTYRNQMVLKFIMGVEPIDSFDSYVAELKSLGIEQAIEYQQNGLDEYNSR